MVSRLAFAFTVVFLLVALASCQTREFAGSPAPQFVATSLDGREVNLYRLKGRPIILYFFASW